jgi:hypothetical protein
VKKTGNLKPFVVLILIVLALSLVLQTFKNTQRYKDNEIALSELEQSYTN